jgi:hypothetical protein
MRLLNTLLATLVLAGSVLADIYLHVPPGSNNRGGETNSNRASNNRLFNSQNNNRGGYNIPQGGSYNFYPGSIIPIQWTAQHGSGIDNVKSDIIIQFMCEPQNSNQLRDGDSGANGQEINRNNFEEEVNNMNIGMHESIEYYRQCMSRERNRGLFTADQNVVNNQGAQATRQNPNGGASGLECQEERDYYPYWHPSPWRDIAILTDRGDLCPYYKMHSNHNDLPCEPVPSSRDNHLGSVSGGEMATYLWTVPENLVGKRCVLRIRYNVTSGDFDAWETFSNRNRNGEVPLTITKANDFLFTNNPTFEVGNGNQIQLNVNTAQYARTFQDRSHIFFVVPRPSGIPRNAMIHNIVVRGRRGNIVQTFPAVEYDFVPNHLTIHSDEYLHFQWTGSNRSPTGAGQGQENTDRNNLIQIPDRESNFPLPYSLADFFTNMDDYYRYATSGGSITIDPNLNNISPYFNGGLIKAPYNTTERTYHFMSSRNNNLSNRSQKMSLTVLPPGNNADQSDRSTVNAGLVAGIVLLLITFIGGIAASVYYRTRSDDKKKAIREKLSKVWERITCRRNKEIQRVPAPRFSLRASKDAFQTAYAQFSRPKPVVTQSV